MKERTLFALAACIAMIFVAQYWVAQNANRFCGQVESKTDATIASLLSDADVNPDRKFIGSLPTDEPHASACELTFVDLVCFRRRCEVEFTTYEMEGTRITSYKHEHGYEFNLFGKILRNETESWKMTFD